MKVLVTGYNGQLGYDVVREARKRNINVTGVTRDDFDITNERDVKSYIYEVNPSVIIHCAAYTAVDKAEDNKEICWDVNVNGTKYLAQAAKQVNAKLMYISTDYVFNGTGNNPFKETDSTDPTGYYGLTKYEGEQIVKKLLDQYFVVRISWVFGINGKNFIRTMLNLAKTRNEVSVVNDQFGSPTYTLDLARLLVDMIQTNNFGVYHASNEGFCSWAELAMEIFELSNLNTVVNPISTEEFPTRAMRPKNSRMSKEQLLDKGFIPLPYWQDAVKRYLKELEEV